MAEGIILILMGMACMALAPKDWFIARCDERFLFVFGERAATIFNTLVGVSLFAIGIVQVLLS